jgi:hypothetical protein
MMNASDVFRHRSRFTAFGFFMPQDLQIRNQQSLSPHGKFPRLLKLFPKAHLATSFRLQPSNHSLSSPFALLISMVPIISVTIP